MKHADAASRQPASMRDAEYRTLCAILEELNPKRTLEVGMASGGSAVVLCRAVRLAGGDTHVAIDPFQSSPDAWDGKGIQAVTDAGFGDMLEMIEDYDYLALPRLVREKREFDFILIDGWHSFDYTFIDLFFADLLLKPGGVLAVHDTGWPAVFKACRFLETHKPYDRLGPPIMVRLDPLAQRLWRRAKQILGGTSAEAKSRREEWMSLGAWRKRESHLVPDAFYAPF